MCRIPNDRYIPMADIEKVYQLWDDYRQGRLARHCLRDVTQHSKYIISLLHQFLDA